MKLLGISDSEPVPMASFRIFLTRVSSLDNRQPGKPQLAWKVAGRGSVPPQRIADSTASFAEMAPQGVAFAGDLQERKFLQQPELTKLLGWRSSPELKTFIDAANSYAAAQLEIQNRYAEWSNLPALQGTVQRLQAELKSLQEKPLSCLLCLGRGAGFVSKSAFLDADLASFRKILRATPAYGNAIRDGAIFPKTRRLAFAGNQPTAFPGWLRFEIEP
jgi:hypothetical protein